MIVSIDWLKEFVDIKEPPDKLADMLSSIGLEAEFLNSFDGLDGVVIGKVKSIEKHPNADRLSVCTVYDGEEDYQVVCGAKNVAKDQTIAYAKVGSVLPGGFRLEKIKLRGVESSGMICSAKELNIHDDHEGIIVLPESCKVGKDFLEEYGNKFLKIELDITPNRPDAFSHYGIARDIAVYTNRKLSNPQFETKGISNVITGVIARKSPYYNQVELNSKGRVIFSKLLSQYIIRRQDAPIVYDMNASIYIWKREALLNYNTLFLEKTSLYIMPEERSVDIDTQLDWNFVEYMFEKSIDIND